MNKPKYEIEDVIKCDAIVGWVQSIYTQLDSDLVREYPQYVYGIVEPKNGHTHYFSEEELS
jgi:hypothetical protein